MIKRFHFIAILSLCFASCSFLKKSQKEIYNKSYIFPLDWIGKYEGELVIFNAQNDTIKAKMQLIIDYPDAQGYYPWTLIYNEEDIRQYGLEAVNPEEGHYRIDEFNSIVLDAFHRGGHFISRFEVLGTDMIIDYHLKQDGIEARFYISQENALSTTGGEKIGDKEVPKVESFKIMAFQSAFLRKKADED